MARMLQYEHVRYGVSFGSALAIAISFTENRSILWSIIDGILSWIYVLYVVLVRAGIVHRLM